MYYKFGDSTLGIEFIKELLHNYYLPRCEVYRDDESCAVGKYYIKGLHITKCTNKHIVDGAPKCEFSYLSHFEEGRFYPNLSEKFKITSLDYDYKTHEWLGEYLRFIRDYRHVDLMPLYNCYSKRVAQNILLQTRVNDFLVEIDTKDDNYNYVIMPVKLSKEYTIAIDCGRKYDIGCIFYDKRFIERNSKELFDETYHSVSSSSFLKPYIFSTKVSDVGKFADCERFMKLLIKLPKSNKSSIVVLEGDCRYGTQHQTSKNPALRKEETRVVNNYNYQISDGSFTKFGTKLSLLQFNDGASYPFADKLITYLIGYAIAPDEDIETNIKTIQSYVYPTTVKQATGV